MFDDQSDYFVSNKYIFVYWSLISREQSVSRFMDNDERFIIAQFLD